MRWLIDQVAGLNLHTQLKELNGGNVCNLLWGLWWIDSHFSSALAELRCEEYFLTLCIQTVCSHRTVWSAVRPLIVDQKSDWLKGERPEVRESCDKIHSHGARQLRSNSWFSGSSMELRFAGRCGFAGVEEEGRCGRVNCLRETWKENPERQIQMLGILCSVVAT